ncbi:MAG: hypothetical protein IPO13_13815 [Rhodocyclaceae bacterium]|nr:hypothetical protein [Rhodocyclaceae bacterium]
MRSLFILSSAILLSACAGQQAVPEKSAPAPAPVAAPAAPAPVAAAPVEKKAPQCYSGDAGKFFNVGDKTTVSGIEVICATNSDGKAGQWAAVKK